MAQIDVAQVDGGVCVWNNVTQGDHVVSICLDNGCCKTLDTVSVGILPNPLQVSVDTVPTCPGEKNGRATVIITGASNPVCRWFRKDGKLLQISCLPLRNLDSGPYFIRVADENGCQNAKDFMIEISAATDADSDGVCDAVDVGGGDGGVCMQVCAGVCR
jgi:hypothetical protein